MARQRAPTPENNWNLTDEQIESIRREYVDERCTLQRTAFRSGVRESVVAMVCRHKRWTRRPWDRPKHVWTREVGAAVQEREARRER
jgi:hypothetical protein